MKINHIGHDRTILFAAKELKEYLQKMDPSAAIIVEESTFPVDGCINIGICEVFDALLPDVADKKYDDAIHIDIKNASGTITGTNVRSVLIAVYRFLRELGCCFIRPGKDNEIIPSCDISAARVHITEAASYRHRENCIEGHVSYEHISEMIDWMPKIGMNSFFMQFLKPYGFFKTWYSHEHNPYMEDNSKSSEEIDWIVEKLEDEIAERGMLYSKVGHSWTTECLGIEASYWDTTDEPVPEHLQQYLALVDGKRGLLNGVPINTDLCYSNPEVQELLSDYVVQYAKNNPHITTIVFWAADSGAGRCQCAGCQKHAMIDWYVKISNIINDKFEEAKLDTKIAFLSLSGHYPTLRFNNPDRFIMMHAPIQRNLCETYPDVVDEEYLSSTPLWEGTDGSARKKHFNSVRNYVKDFKKWQEVFPGDNEIFDYQLIWFYNMDPGNMICAENLSRDMRNLKAMNINGMSSCQSQRVFWPTALPMVAMAETLWNRDTDFETLKTSYLTGAFGKDGVKLGELLTKLGNRRISHFMCSNDALNWDLIADEKTVAELTATYPVIAELKELIARNVKDTTLPEAVLRSWQYLTCYPDYIRGYIDMWIAAFGEADIPKARQLSVELIDYVRKNEYQIHRVFDGTLFMRRLLHCINSTKLPGDAIHVAGELRLP